MEKKRVYTIAEELGISSKELIAKLEELDIKVSSHMSTLTIEEAEIIVEMLREEKEAKIIKQKEPKSKKIDIDTIKEDDEEEQSRRDLDKKNKNKNNKNTGNDKNNNNKKNKHPQKDEKYSVTSVDEKEDKEADKKEVQTEDGIIMLDETVVVGDFANLMGVPATQIIMSLMKMRWNYGGRDRGINQAMT